MASVTAVRERLAGNEQTPGVNPTITRVTELTVRFDDGKTSSINIEPGQIFLVGDRVIVTSRNGNTYITHD